MSVAPHAGQNRIMIYGPSVCSRIMIYGPSVCSGDGLRDCCPPASCEAGAS